MDSSEVRRMSPEEKEAFHLEAEARMQPIKFAHPDCNRRRADVVLAPKVPSTGPGSNPDAFSCAWINLISCLVGIFLATSFLADSAGAGTFDSPGCVSAP